MNKIFKGCNSLLFIPDITKWYLNIPEDFNISSFNSNSLSIKQKKSDSIISENMREYFNSSKVSSSLKANNDIKSFENIDNQDFSKNNELDEFYDNFYN